VPAFPYCIATITSNCFSNGYSNALRWRLLTRTVCSPEIIRRRQTRFDFQPTGCIRKNGHCVMLAETFQRNSGPGMRTVRAPQQDLPSRNMDRNRIPCHRRSMTARLLTPERRLPGPGIGTLTLRTKQSGANTSIYRGQCKRAASAQADPDRSCPRIGEQHADANLRYFSDLDGMREIPVSK